MDDNTLKKAVYNYDSTVCYIKRYNGSRWVIDAGTGMLLLYIPYNSDHYDFGPWHLKEMAKIMAKH